MPVAFNNNEKTISTFAFLDEGSSLTLIEEDLAKELHLRSTPENLCLRWTADMVREEPDSERVSVKISGNYEGAKTYVLNDVRTVKELSLPTQSISAEHIAAEFKHLSNIPINSYTNAVPKILIGINNWKLGIPTVVKEGKWQQPVATKTRLGWVIHGVKEAVSAVHYLYIHSSDCRYDKKLIKEFFSLDNFGVSTKENYEESAEDKRAQTILESSTALNSDHYETGLLWKHDAIVLPSSLEMAKKRLFCLERKHKKCPEMKTNLDKQRAEYVQKGYANPDNMQVRKTSY